MEKLTINKSTLEQTRTSPKKLPEFVKVMEENEAWKDDAKMGNYFAEFRLVSRL